VHKRSKERDDESKVTVIFEVLFYLIPGMFVFLVIPAALFVMIEEWSFLDSLYYAFVTLTTIGTDNDMRLAILFKSTKV